MEKETIIFSLYPTWYCNFKCPYCIAQTADDKGHILSMFDEHSVDEWIDALSIYGKCYDIELCISGGDPLCLKQTFEFLGKVTKLPFVKYIRIDHNMSKVDQLISECCSDKIQINGSWHPLYLDYGTIRKRAFLLAQHNMLGMINFVASRDNIQYLEKHHLDLDNIVVACEKEGIFINIATDIHYRDDKGYVSQYERFISPRDQNYLIGGMSSLGVPCGASMHYFTLEWNGNIETCMGLEDDKLTYNAGRNVVGNLFKHTLQRKRTHCGMRCSNCIVMYVQREDNAFPSMKHLNGYKERTIQWRKTVRLQKESV